MDTWPDSVSSFCRLIVDGNWTYSADHPTAQDGDNINNILDVVASLDPERSEKLLRYLSQVRKGILNARFKLGPVTWYYPTN